MSGSDENEQNEVGGDLCSTHELDHLFDESLRIASEEAISLQKDYILHLDSTRNFDRIAAVTSSRAVHLFDLNDSKGFVQIQRYDDNLFTSKAKLPISGIRFANENPTTLFVAEATGHIYMYDIRAKPTAVQTFHDADIAPKTFTCFDVNSNDTLLCAGAERSKDDAYIVLFDTRQRSTFATYTDSHRNDLTQVKFHPNKSKVLASGSTDGLINVFNANETDDYDALVYCLNTESSVQTLNWHPRQSAMQVSNDDDDDNDDNDDDDDDEHTSNANSSTDLISCITDTNDFQLFDVNESELLFQAKRSETSAFIKPNKESECYLVNCHNHTPNEDIFLLAGSHLGGGNCLRSLTVHDKSLKPRHNFNENKQIVRCSLYNSKDNVLITAGEGGIVTVWSHFETSKADGHKLKEKVKNKAQRKSKPY